MIVLEISLIRTDNIAVEPGLLPTVAGAFGGRQLLRHVRPIVDVVGADGRHFPLGRHL